MKLVICNWKMNPDTLADAQVLFGHTKRIAQTCTHAEIIVAPPTVFLAPLTRAYRGERVAFAAQTLSTHERGSHTGEVSARQVRDAGATYAIIGHAEQRARGVRDAQVAEKVHRTREAKLTPIVAVGERERDESGEYLQTLRTQLAAVFTDMSAKAAASIIVAYEPVWAIGAPKAPDAQAVHQMMLLVRKIVAEHYSAALAARMRIVYGGAVDETSAESILAIPDVSGVLVGRASLDPEKLHAIARAAHTT